jgi:hypothetical protein
MRDVVPDCGEESFSTLQAFALRKSAHSEARFVGKKASCAAKPVVLSNKSRVRFIWG